MKSKIKLNSMQNSTLQGLFDDYISYQKNYSEFYCRVSTNKETQKTDRQVLVLQEYAKQNNFKMKL